MGASINNRNHQPCLMVPVLKPDAAPDKNPVYGKK
jgi:hypothetical protein